MSKGGWVKRRLCWIGVVLSLTACAGETGERQDLGTEARTDALSPLRVGALLGSGDVAGFERAFEPRPFSFPADHGPHPDFQSEWWYFVGNLATGDAEASDAGDGRRFGFQLTFFRFAIAPEDSKTAERSSRWATRQIWMAHFALTDAEAGRFHAFERFRRGAMGLAGATAGAGNTFRVWLDDWRAEGLQTGSLLPVRLFASAGQDDSDDPDQTPIALDLTLSPGKPPVLQGDAGLSQKGPEPGNASYYYSLTRLPARGAVTVGSERFEVTGSAWLDREWSTSALGTNEVGWDWFALQLDAGEPRELMLYRIRRADGTATATSSGTWVAPDGSAQRVAREDATDQDATIEILDRWKSPHSDALYPAGWRIRLPEQALDLTLRPVLADQELNVSFRYWEGAVDVQGTRAGRPVTGRGYVELTGYRAQ